jgi:hypothetical protein
MCEAAHDFLRRRGLRSGDPNLDKSSIKESEDEGRYLMLGISINLRRGWARLAFTSALLLCGPGLPADVPPGGKEGKPKEFIQGIQAQDRKRWAQSADLMRAAAAKLSGDGEMVRIYGTRFEPYLPLYYLGLALYKQGDCPGALVEWRKCVSSDALKRTDRRDVLLQYIEEAGNCPGR